MLISEIIKQKNISMYRLSRNCDVPYSTINDICSGKSSIEKCSAETVYKISRELGVSMEELIEPYVNKRENFELFKSSICHELKEKGDINFIIDVLESDDIGKYFRMKWYRESLYLLGMLDYVSRVNDIPVSSYYNDIRKCRLKETIYPSGIIALYTATGDDNIKLKAIEDSIPEFRQFNIIESDVRNVI